MDNSEDSPAISTTDDSVTEGISPTQRGATAASLGSRDSLDELNTGCATTLRMLIEELLRMRTNEDDSILVRYLCIN